MAKIKVLDESVKSSSVSSVVKIFENPEFGKIRTVVIGGEPWFVGNDVAIILGYKYPKNAIRDNVDEEDKMVVRMSDIKKDIPVYMRGFKITIINKRGFSSFIFKSKKLSQKKKAYFAKLLDIPITLFSRKEIEFKDAFLDCFKAMGLEVKCQYRVGKYRADFYIPYLNLVVEYDENEHSSYNKKSESIRKAYIVDSLGCGMIRVSDKNSNSYNIGLIIKEILGGEYKGVCKTCYR